MKIILKQDVKTIGKKDEIHEVSDGYARNFLFPRNLAAPADAAALNLSLFLAVATIAPEARVLLLFFIPIKMKYMAWVYLGGTVLSMFLYLRIAPFLSFYWLLPIVPLLNYLLFFGSDVKNILPDALR